MQSYAQQEVTAVRRVYVRLSPEYVETIVRLAERERRDPADQAGLLLERQLAQYMPTRAVEQTENAWVGAGSEQGTT